MIVNERELEEIMKETTKNTMKEPIRQTGEERLNESIKMTKMGEKREKKT